MLPSFPTKDGSVLAPFTAAPSPSPPALEEQLGPGGCWLAPNKPSGAALRSEALPQNGPHSDSFITTGLYAWACSLLGMEVRRRLCSLAKALGGCQMQGIGGHFVWSSLEGLTPCLGTRHHPPCDAPTGLSKVENDEHWAV